MSGRVRHRITRVVAGKIYARKPRPKPKAPFPIDWDLVAAIDSTPIGTSLKPKGECYDCNRRVSGERRFCGLCAAKREAR